MYKLFKGLAALLMSHEKSFDELKQLVLHHQNLCSNTIAELFKLNSCVRIFFQLGFTLCEAEQPLQGMELQE